MCSAAVFWGCSGTLGVSFEMQTVLRVIRGANFNALRAILKPLGAHLGGSGGGLGGLGAPFGGSGAVLGPSWPLLNPSSQFWLALGRLLAALGSLLAALGPLLGRSWAALGRSWVALGPLLEPKEPQHKKKPDPAVNGKRRVQTLFVIQERLICICLLYV